MPVSFLGEMLDAREQLEAARGNPAETERLASAFAARYNGFIGTVAGLFQRYETGPADAPDRANLLKQIRATLNAAKYVRGLIRDLYSE
jgi:molecular chaperone HscB